MGDCVSRPQKLTKTLAANSILTISIFAAPQGFNYDDYSISVSTINLKPSFGAIYKEENIWKVSKTPINVSEGLYFTWDANSISVSLQSKAKLPLFRPISNQEAEIGIRSRFRCNEYEMAVLKVKISSSDSFFESIKLPALLSLKECAKLNILCRVCAQANDTYENRLLKLCECNMSHVHMNCSFFNLLNTSKESELGSRIDIPLTACPACDRNPNLMESGIRYILSQYCADNYPKIQTPSILLQSSKIIENGEAKYVSFVEISLGSKMSCKMLKSFKNPNAKTISLRVNDLKRIFVAPLEISTTLWVEQNGAFDIQPKAQKLALYGDALIKLSIQET